MNIKRCVSFPPARWVQAALPPPKTDYSWAERALTNPPQMPAWCWLKDGKTKKKRGEKRKKFFFFLIDVRCSSTADIWTWGCAVDGMNYGRFCIQFAVTVEVTIVFCFSGSTCSVKGLFFSPVVRDDREHFYLCKFSWKRASFKFRSYITPHTEVASQLTW